MRNFGIKLDQPSKKNWATLRVKLLLTEALSGWKCLSGSNYIPILAAEVPAFELERSKNSVTMHNLFYVNPTISFFPSSPFYPFTSGVKPSNMKITSSGQMDLLTAVPGTSVLYVHTMLKKLLNQLSVPLLSPIKVVEDI